MSRVSRDVRAKRIYDPPEPADGYRVLIDHVWPRGVSHERARLDLWARELAPSDELRKWFDHRPERWAEFQQLYRAELRENPAVDLLRTRSAAGMVTLLYGSRNRAFNHAAVLADFLRETNSFAR